MINIFLIQISLLFSCFLPTIENQQEDWTLKKDKNGIKIFTRKAANAEIFEFKAVMKVRADRKKLEALIENISAYPDWQADLESVKVLERTSPGQQIFYIVSKVPWPLKNRDLVLKFRKEENKDVLLYEIESVLEKEPLKKEYVRIEEAAGFWRFKPLNDIEYQITYQFFADPAGNIPSSLVNMFLVEGPFKTLSNLKEKVES